MPLSLEAMIWPYRGLSLSRWSGTAILRSRASFDPDRLDFFPFLVRRPSGCLPRKILNSERDKVRKCIISIYRVVHLVR